MTSPALEVQYEAQPGPARKALIEETFTIEPCRSISDGRAARAIKKEPVRLIRSVRSHGTHATDVLP
jgi:hypothetical protein